MARYILRRVGISIITLLLIVILLFLLERLMPGTPFNDEKLKPEQIEILYAKYGLTDEEIAFIESMIKPMDLGDSNA